MIDNIITAYLRKNKRLVVPDFGAFIHKDDGEVVFVEFLKKDDGVLAGLLNREYSADESEARGMIDEYVSNIRRTVGATGRYAVEGLGTLRTDANGLYALAYDPRVRSERAEVPHVMAEEPEPERQEPKMRVVTREMIVEEAPAPSVGDDIIMAVHEKDIEIGTNKTMEFALPVREPETAEPDDKKTFTLNDLYAMPAAEERRIKPQAPKPSARDTRREWAAEEAEHRARQQAAGPKRPAQRPDERPAGVRPANPRQPEGRPARDPRQTDVRPTGTPRVQTARPQARPANRGGRSKADWVMMIAIAVALFALGTMIYGMFLRQDPAITPTRPDVENIDGAGMPDDGSGTTEEEANGEVPESGE